MKTNEFQSSKKKVYQQKTKQENKDILDSENNNLPKWLEVIILAIALLFSIYILYH